MPIIGNCQPAACAHSLDGREVVRDIRNRLVHLYDDHVPASTPAYDQLKLVLDAWDEFEYTYGTVEEASERSCHDL